MTIEKSVLRTHIYNEIGAKADDFLDTYKLELRETEGALQGIARSQAAVEGLFSHVDREIDALKINLETGKLIKDWLVRAGQAVQTLRVNAQNHVFVAKGKIEATQRQVEFLKKAYDVEKARLEAYAQPQEAAGNVFPIGHVPETRERPVSLKTRRTAEGQAAPAPTKPKAKRGRKPKAMPAAPPVEQAPETPPEQPA